MPLNPLTLVPASSKAKDVATLADVPTSTNGSGPPSSTTEPISSHYIDLNTNITWIYTSLGWKREADPSALTNATLQSSFNSNVTVIDGGKIQTGTLNANTITANGSIASPNIYGGKIYGSTLEGTVIQGAIIRASYIDYADAIGLSLFPSNSGGLIVDPTVTAFTTNDTTLTDINGITSTGVTPTSTIVVDGVTVHLRDIFATTFNEISQQTELVAYEYSISGVPTNCYKIIWKGPYVLNALAAVSYTNTKQAVNQGPWYYYTYSGNIRQTFPYYGQFSIDGSIPRSRFPVYTDIANSGKIVEFRLGQDVNSINHGEFIFNLFGYTYKFYVTNTTAYMQKKVIGSNDSTYVGTALNQVANGYTFLTYTSSYQVLHYTYDFHHGYATPNYGYVRSLHIGNTSGVLDLSQMPDGISYGGGGNYYEPIRIGIRNYHSASYCKCTSYSNTLTETV